MGREEITRFVSQARAAQECAQGRTIGAKGIFQHTKRNGEVRGWGKGGHLEKGNTLHHHQVATEGMFSETQLWTQAPNIYPRLLPGV